ncbi:MAG: ABC transporter substrate-binding protein [Actinomycetes bacterium]|nr:MAG: hemin receptor [Actinomycetota bacterium]
MTARIRQASAAAALVAVLALAGCAGSTSTGEPTADPGAGHAITYAGPLGPEDVLADPKAYVGETTARIVRTMVERYEPPSPADLQLPAEVISYDPGGESTVTVDNADRIVAVDVSGSIAATLVWMGLGDRVVGHDGSTELPELADAPVVTSSGHVIDPEAVLAQEPTLVITDGSIGPQDGFAQLRDAGVAVVYIQDLEGFEGAQERIRQVGAVVGMSARGEALAEDLGLAIAEVTDEVHAIAPGKQEDRLRMAFLYLRGSAGVYYLFAEESGASDLIYALGGIDVAKENGIRGLAPLTDEAVLAANPDVILVMTDGLESVGGVDGLLASKPAIALTAAGENRRFIVMDDRELLGFGPRSADVLDALARAIYAPDAK